MRKFNVLLAMGLIGTAAAATLLAGSPNAFAQTKPAVPAPAPAATPPAAATPAAPIPAVSPPKPACNNPDALGVARSVEIDTTGGPGFGFEHFKQMDFLRDKEVVLTFDDGPWPGNTPAVLKALANECTTGIFFPIGEHATWHPEILKEVAAAGHVIGSHTWSHANLNNKKFTANQQASKDEIEKGISAVRWALGTPEAPFFRFPDLQHPPEMVKYLGDRNVAIWSCDLDSFDFKASKPQTVIDTVFRQLDKLGKGIILMHDFQKHTAEALPALLRRLKTEGYKVVQVKAKQPVATLPQYDQTMSQEAALPTVNTRPVSAVVKDVTE